MQQRGCLWLSPEYFVSFKGFEAHDEFLWCHRYITGFFIVLGALDLFRK